MGLAEARDIMRQFKDEASGAADEVERLNKLGAAAANTFDPGGVQTVQQPGFQARPGFRAGGGLQGGLTDIIVDQFGRPIPGAVPRVSGGSGGGGGGNGITTTNPFVNRVSGRSGGGGAGGGSGGGERFTPGPPTLTGGQFLGGTDSTNGSRASQGSGVTAGDQAVVEAVNGLRETIERNASEITPTFVRAAR